MRLVSTVGIMLMMVGLCPLSGRTQESAEGLVNPIHGNSVNVSQMPADNTPATTEGEGADHQSSPGEAPMTSEPFTILTPTDKVVARFMKLDTDASGGVSLDEYMAMVRKHAEARYAAMDTNGDGEVTDKEYRAFWKSRMAHWYRLKR